MCVSNDRAIARTIFNLATNCPSNDVRMRHSENVWEGVPGTEMMISELKMR